MQNEPDLNVLPEYIANVHTSLIRRHPTNQIAYNTMCPDESLDSMALIEDLEIFQDCCYDTEQNDKPIRQRTGKAFGLYLWNHPHHWGNLGYDICTLERSAKTPDVMSSKSAHEEATSGDTTDRSLEESVLKRIRQIKPHYQDFVSYRRRMGDNLRHNIIEEPRNLRKGQYFEKAYKFFGKFLETQEVLRILNTTFKSRLFEYGNWTREGTIFLFTKDDKERRRLFESYTVDYYAQSKVSSCLARPLSRSWARRDLEICLRNLPVSVISIAGKDFKAEMDAFEALAVSAKEYKEKFRESLDADNKHDYDSQLDDMRSTVKDKLHDFAKLLIDREDSDETYEILVKYLPDNIQRQIKLERDRGYTEEEVWTPDSWRMLKAMASDVVYTTLVGCASILAEIPVGNMNSSMYDGWISRVTALVGRRESSTTS